MMDPNLHPLSPPSPEISLKLKAIRATNPTKKSLESRKIHLLDPKIIKLMLEIKVQEQKNNLIINQVFKKVTCRSKVRQKRLKLKKKAKNQNC